MTTRTIAGTITALGPHYARNDGDIFTYVEITEPDGRRISIEKVAVGSETRALVCIEAAGEFFLDRTFFVTGALRYHLWGVKAAGLAAFDRKNLRSVAGSLHLFLGILTLPLMGLGIPLVVLGLYQWLSIPSSKQARKRRFYGDKAEAASVTRQAEATRI